MTAPVFDLSEPDFAPIRARLARVYMEHKSDLGIRHDNDVVRQVDDITLTLLQAVGRATLTGKYDFLTQYGWFISIVADLLRRPAKLDG